MTVTCAWRFLELRMRSISSIMRVALAARLVNHEAQRVLPEGRQQDTSKKVIERLERIIIEPSRIKRLDLHIEIMAKNGARQEVDDHDGDEDDDFWSHE